MLESDQDRKGDIEQKTGAIGQNIVPDSNRQVHWEVYKIAVHEPFENPENVVETLLLKMLVQSR